MVGAIDMARSTHAEPSRLSGLEGDSMFRMHSQQQRAPYSPEWLVTHPFMQGFDLGCTILQHAACLSQDQPDCLPNDEHGWSAIACWAFFIAGTSSCCCQSMEQQAAAILPVYVIYLRGAEANKAAA